jgi:hypothetical protein
MHFGVQNDVLIDVLIVDGLIKQSNMSIMFSPHRTIQNI